MLDINKDEPSDLWISSLRERFPCEPEVDRFLSAKLKQRQGVTFSPVTLLEMCEAISNLLEEKLAGPFEIKAARWLTGGASKLQMAFELDWQSDHGAAITTPMVLRMQPAASIVESSRLREYQIIKAIEHRLPVPKAFWVDNDGRHLPYPALIYELAQGVTKPTKGVGGEVSGMGTNYGPRLRQLLAPQFVTNLAKLHTFRRQDEDFSAFEIPPLGTLAVERQLNWWSRVAEEDSPAEIPLLSVAAQWLRAEMPQVDEVSLLHGDYRCGNFMFDEQSGQITAWLDWELGHFGDRHEDLAWCTARTWGHPDEHTGEDLICGLMREEDFLSSYQEAAGLSVNLDTLRYYKVLNTWKLSIMSLFTAYRTASGGKTHQDVLVAWCLGVGSKFMEQLTGTLEGVL